MSRLIYADALLEKMSGHCDVCQYHSLRSPRCCDCDWSEAMDDVDDMDDVEIEPVRHGHWITKTRHEHYPSGKEYEEDYCSLCSMRGSIEYDYCPHCGAKMDEAFEWLD